MIWLPKERCGVMNYPIICISREYASGGREIGKELAKALNIPFYDRSLVEQAAVESGLSPEFIAQTEQKFRGSMLFTLSMAGHNVTPAGDTLADQVFAAQRKVVLDVASKGPCVIVGRCADYILRDMPNLFTVFITADMDYRKKRAVEQYNCDPQKAEKTIRMMDKQRSRHYHYYTDRTWGDRSLYTMILNRSRLGDSLCVELLEKAIKAQT